MSTKTLKDPALQDYYEALFEMYGTKGWQMLMEDAGRMLETHDRLVGIDTSEALWFRKGELAQMEWLKGHRAAVEHAYAELIEEQDGTPSEETGGRAQVIA